MLFRSEAAHRRWTRALLASDATPLRSPSPRWWPRLIAAAVWREVIWPCRGAWAGMAVAWLVIVAVQLNLSSDGAKGAMASSTSAPAFQTWEEQQRLLAELIPPPTAEPAAEPPRRQDGRPRSEGRFRQHIG